mgnify:CR=1 FL=1
MAKKAELQDKKVHEVVERDPDMTDEEWRALQLELLRRLERERYRYYEPTGVGEEFIDAVACGDNFIVLYSAANGVGKTATGANILAHLFWNTGENVYFNEGIFKEFPWKKKGRIVSDPTNLTKNIIPELKFWFPEGRYTTHKGNKTFESIFETDTGWEFDLMTYEQDAREFEGVTLGWAWFDEPPPEAIFKATVSRMRKGGIIIITATPLAGSAYLYDAFAKGNYKVEVTSEEGGVTAEYTRKVAYIEAGIESACKQHGIRGHLEHEHIMNIIAEYSEEEKQARIYGKFQHLVGLVFKRWNRKIHVIKPFALNPADYVVWHALDPHPRTRDAGLWVAIDRKGRKFVVDELWVKPENGTKELAYLINNKNAQYRVVKQLIDPSASIVNQHDEDGKSLTERLNGYGLSYEDGTKERTLSNQRIMDAMTYQKLESGEFIEAPELYVFENCQQLIYEIEHWRWQELKGRSAETKNVPNAPIDKDDHLIEDLGRILIQEPRWFPLPPKSQRAEPVKFDPYD